MTGKGALQSAIRKNLSHMILFRMSSNMDVLNTDILNMEKKKFNELIRFVYDKPHQFLLIKLNTLEMYKNYDTIISR